MESLSVMEFELVSQILGVFCRKTACVGTHGTECRATLLVMNIHPRVEKCFAKGDLYRY